MKARLIGASWCLVLAYWLGSVSAGAATTVWQYGGVDHDWSTAGNWTAGEPGSGDTASIGSTAGDVVGEATITSAGEVCRDFFIGNQSTATGCLTITSGDLTVENYFYLGVNGYGVVTQNAGTVTCSSGTSTKGLKIGNSSGASGTYVLNNATFSAPNAGITLGVNIGATGLFRQTGATALTEAANLGVRGAGSTLEMSGGVMRIVPGPLTVGSAAGTSATVEQTGGDIVSTNATDSVTCAIGGSSGTGVYHLVSGTLTVSRFSVGSMGTMEQEAGTTNHCRHIVNTSGRYIMHGGVWTCDNNVTFGPSVGTFGRLEGYGEVRCTGQFRLNRGSCRADGGGSDHDLDLTGCLTITHQVDNGAEETNGWYAVSGGRVLWPDKNSGATLYWGENNGPDSVNAVKMTFTGQGAGVVTGALYAADRSDVPEINGDVTAVWKFDPTFSFTDVDLTFRYDHAAAAALGITDENDLKVYRYDSTPGIEWTTNNLPTPTIDTNNNTIAVNNLTPLVGLGWFAVGKDITGYVPPTGTVITIM